MAEDNNWVEQAVIVKKTHPWVRTKAQAARLAKFHSPSKPRKTEETKKSFRVIERPARCFRLFRSQKRGANVTIVWGKLKKGAARTKACRAK